MVVKMEKVEMLEVEVVVVEREVKVEEDVKKNTLWGFINEEHLHGLGCFCPSSPTLQSLSHSFSLFLV